MSSAWEPPTPEALQRLLPQYEISGLLGRGGMGAVYEGRQAKLDRRVAIKVLPEVFTQAKDQMNSARRFEQEAQAMAGLDHPAILSVYDFGETSEDQLYFVMEFIDGMDLHQYLQSHGGKLSQEQAMAIIAHVLDALDYAHGRGIVHRDIKPANILLNREGRVKIADFGLAKKFGEAGGESVPALTMTNVAVGTPDFVAPEALDSDARPDHRADLYAVGVMLYQMLTGKIPRGNYRSPSEMDAGIDPRLDAIVSKAMASDPDYRYASAAAVRADLDAVFSQPFAKADPGIKSAAVPTVVPVTGSVRGARGKTPTGGGKHEPPVPGKPKVALYGGIVAVVLAVLVAGIIVMGTRRGKVGEPSGTGSPPLVSTKAAGEPTRAFFATGPDVPPPAEEPSTLPANYDEAQYVLAGDWGPIPDTFPLERPKRATEPCVMIAFRIDGEAVDAEAFAEGFKGLPFELGEIVDLAGCDELSMIRVKPIGITGNGGVRFLSATERAKAMDERSDVLRAEVSPDFTAVLLEDGRVAVISLNLGAFASADPTEESLDRVDEWRDIAQIAVCRGSVLGLRSDGVPFACGKNHRGQVSIPEDFKGSILRVGASRTSATSWVVRQDGRSRTFTSFGEENPSLEVRASGRVFGMSGSQRGLVSMDENGRFHTASYGQTSPIHPKQLTGRAMKDAQLMNAVLMEGVQVAAVREGTRSWRFWGNTGDIMGFDPKWCEARAEGCRKLVLAPPYVIGLKPKAFLTPDDWTGASHGESEPGTVAPAATPDAAAPARTTDNPLSASKEQPFENSLGMRFVPVPGTEVLFTSSWGSSRRQTRNSNRLTLPRRVTRSNLE